MGFIGDTIESIRSMQVRQVLAQIISLGMIVTSALIIWKGLIVVTGSESPVVVVLSGSMEPGFKRGDILFLHMSKDPIRTGEIVVFNVDVSLTETFLSFSWYRFMNARRVQKLTSSQKVITILGMTDFCMHMGSFGFSNIILWGELLVFCHMLDGLQLS
ncbi:uncharacterized protein [Oryza sativa Japonica Group]|uniref:uncharacterized protein isoform X2 n=1 Tax=Oryza sativa subsp. japonica TaxID=39947 RepID=UPI00339CC1E1